MTVFAGMLLVLEMFGGQQVPGVEPRLETLFEETEQQNMKDLEEKAQPVQPQHGITDCKL